MQECAPMVTRARLSTHKSSPSQEWSPTSKYHGNFTRSPGLIYTPLPTLAPNSRRSQHRNDEDVINEVRSKGRAKKYHRTSTTRGAPSRRSRAATSTRRGCHEVGRCGWTGGSSNTRGCSRDFPRDRGGFSTLAPPQPRLPPVGPSLAATQIFISTPGPASPWPCVRPTASHVCEDPRTRASGSS